MGEEAVQETSLGILGGLARPLLLGQYPRRFWVQVVGLAWVPQTGTWVVARDGTYRTFPSPARLFLF